MLIRDAELNYVKLLKPSPDLSGELTYSVAIYLNPEHPQLPDIEGEITRIAEDRFGPKFADMRKRGALKWPIRSSVQLKGATSENGYFFNARAKHDKTKPRQGQPIIVDAKKNPITSPSHCYSGCYANVAVNFYAFDVGGSKGVAAGLAGVQVTLLGENKSGMAMHADELFDEEEGFQLQESMFDVTESRNGNPASFEGDAGDPEAELTDQELAELEQQRDDF